MDVELKQIILKSKIKVKYEKFKIKIQGANGLQNFYLGFCLCYEIMHTIKLSNFVSFAPTITSTRSCA